MRDDGSQATLPQVPAIPATLEEATDRDWLTAALAPLSGGARVESVELAEVIRTMASKVRVRVRFAGDPAVHDYCLKAFLGEPGLGGLTTIREGKFYTDIAPHLTMLLPRVPAVILDEEKGQGILVMEDMITAGARFCTALEPFTIERVTKSLDQLARLHSRADIAAATDWLPVRIDWIASKFHFSPERQQELLDNPAYAALPDRTRSGKLLHAGMTALSKRNATKPRTMLHGDCHAGNLFMIGEQPGFTDWQLVQRGYWAMDVAYHINAVLPIEVAENHERELLNGYLDALASHGGEAPDRETAWADYRASTVYGFYHWAITTRVDPQLTRIFVERLGGAVTRHDTYTLLGL